MNCKIYLFQLVFLGLFGCNTQKAILDYESKNLKIEKIAKNTFQHISYLNTEDYGKVACNGMIVMDGGEAIIFDTPVNDADSKELINWVQATLECKVKGVVITHFHIDCLGGLQEFHQKQIPSYASNKTIDLAKSNNMVSPKNGFDNYLELKVGHKKVINEFLGEGHTKDNIISYFPKDKVLFGGCLIKGNGAGKGNLADANVNDWSKTVKKVKTKYQNALIIIPGHGKAGGQELLNYTIELFKKE